MRNRYDSAAKISEYQGPLFQIHGEADKLVPMKHGRQLHDSCPSTDKLFVAVPNLGHNSRLPVAVEQQTRAFLRAHSILQP